MADELTKIAAIAPLGKGIGSPTNLLYKAKRVGANTPPSMALRPPIPPIGGPKLPSVTHTSAPPNMMRSSGSVPRAPNVPAM